MSNKITLNGQELFPARYFTAQDLPTGKSFVVEIKEIKIEEMHNPQTKQTERKPVIYFVQPKRGTVMGDEFAVSISNALNGELNAEKWIGHKIIIERKAVRISKAGEILKEGIRARAVGTNHAEKTPPPEQEEEEE